MIYTNKKPSNYKMMHNMFDRQIFRNNSDWSDLWGVQVGGVRENFFVSYALNGEVADHSNGNRYGLPARHNLCNSPVKQPSPLNSENTIDCNDRRDWNGVS
jgi:hypothetical protein